MMMNSSYSQYHEARIGGDSGNGDIIGNLTRGCVIDRLSMMCHQERTLYSYRRPDNNNKNNNNTKVVGAFPQAPSSIVDETIPPLNSAWREKICHWSFNVIDHFDLSREVVAVSMSLFDRFLATRSNRCNGSTALLASLTTLHIAIKVHEVRKIKLTSEYINIYIIEKTAVNMQSSSAIYILYILTSLILFSILNIQHLPI